MSVRDAKDVVAVRGIDECDSITERLNFWCRRPRTRPAYWEWTLARPDPTDRPDQCVIERQRILSGRRGRPVSGCLTVFALPHIAKFVVDTLNELAHFFGSR